MAKVRLTAEFEIDDSLISRDNEGNPLPGWIEQIVFDRLINAAKLHLLVNNTKVVASREIDATQTDAYVALNELYLSMLDSFESTVKLEYGNDFSNPLKTLQTILKLIASLKNHPDGITAQTWELAVVPEIRKSLEDAGFDISNNHIQ
jgi:hypothetical protein